jgi:hypothetical protein
MIDTRSLIPPAIVLALGLFSAALVVSLTLRDIIWSLHNELSVTGSTKKSVISDEVKWTAEISRTVVSKSGVDQAYKDVQKDFAAVRTVLLGAGIPEEEISTFPIYVSEMYDDQSKGAAPPTYRVAQTIVVRSKNVEKVELLAKNNAPLLTQGVFINTNALEYFYSKLPNLRVELLGAAIQDARARAEEIAKASGAKVGALKSASSGVVQVLAPNSIDVSDYGTYDTSSKEKEVSVTVRASFMLE